MTDGRHVKVQAARVLEHIRTLDEHYGAVISASDPELAEALASATAALTRFLADPAADDLSADR